MSLLDNAFEPFDEEDEKPKKPKKKGLFKKAQNSVKPRAKTLLKSK